MQKGIYKRIFSVVIVLAMTLTLFVLPQASATVVDTNTSLARQVANEGIVLLKNDNNALPLADGAVGGVTGENVAIFGQGQIYNASLTEGFQIAGAGSAKTQPKSVVDPLTALSALEDAGRITVYNELSAEYEADMAYVPDDAMYTAVGENADTAIVIITRNPSASGDRNEADWNLTESEKGILKELSALKSNEKLDKIIVLLNIGSTMDTSWAKEGNQDGIDVDAVLAVWYTGEQGGNAIADILMGDANPSGKLSDTFTETIDYLNPLVAGQAVTLSEDIFVGYRYFETFGIDVSYPFGYGLSYTSFEFGTPSYSESNGEITVSVDVKNTGSVAGKEVVQVYYSAPQRGVGDAVMSKASIELAAFKKTGLIQPGETETVTVKYDVKDMASYDDEGVTGNKSAYVLEAGDYKVFVGNSVKEAQTRQVGTYKVDSLTVTEQLKQYLAPKTAFNKIVVENDGTNITQGTQVVATGTDTIVADRSHTPYTGEAASKIIPFSDVISGNATYEQFVAQMSVEELANIAVGQRYGALGGSSKGSIGAGETINEKYGIPEADTANGPCGIDIGSKATSWGSEVLMACTWNTDLIYQLGEGMGSEAAISNVDILLTTSMNIHRHPLNGRHFEYFSEDPVLTGEMGSSQMQGIQSQGVTVTLKHFAVYGKRAYNADNAIVTERAAREIYLKGFETAVKDSAAGGEPLAIMSSYNKINGTFSSESKGLMTGILRNEWGFDGIVISDWGAAADPSKSLLAGNNVKMPGSQSDDSQRTTYIEDYVTAYNSGEITRNQLELNAIDILKVLAELPDAAKLGTATNIALNKTVYTDLASTAAKNAWAATSGNQSAAAMTDGDTSTSYYAGPAFVTVDLGAVYPISTIQLVLGTQTTNTSAYTNYVIYGSQNFPDSTIIGEDTTAIGTAVDAWVAAGKGKRLTATGGSSGGTITYNLSGTHEYRYISVLKNYPSGLDIAEIRVTPSNGRNDNKTSVNLVPTSRIYASSIYTDNENKPYPVKNICDNSAGTCWMAREYNAYAKGRLVVDLGKEVPIHLIEFIAGGMTDHRTNFSIYLSNDNDFEDKTQLYTMSSEDTALTANRVYRLFPEGASYRYVMYECNTPGATTSLSEIRVYADSNVGAQEDNSLFTLSDLCPVSASTAYSGMSTGRVNDMTNQTTFITSHGNYNKEGYIFIDLEKARKLDSVSLIMATTSGKNDAATVEDLRTDFQIVARNDSIFSNAAGDVILYNNSDILAEGNGNSSDLCVFEVPDEYKNTEYRYVGIRKKPTTNNNSIGQMGVTEMRVFGKAANYQHSIDKPTATYDKESGTVTVSTIVRTLEDRPYKFIIAGYDENGILVETEFVELKKASETARSEKGSEVQGIDYASGITKTVTLDKHLDSAYAKVMLINDFENLTPMAGYTQIELNPPAPPVQLLYDSVITYMTTDFEDAVPPKNRPCITEQKDVVIEWEAVEGATEYTFTLSTNPDYTDGNTYAITTNSHTVNNLYVGAEYFWKAVSDNGTEITGSFKTQDYTPRFITTDSVDNVRDLGGWTTESGKKIKQGLIYRGATLSDDKTTDTSNYLLNGEILLSDNDKNVFVNDLGIKSDIDLRGSGEKNGRTESPLGNGVTYFDLVINADSTAFTTKDALGKVFKAMADENNYPIYFHCTGGCDRTGRVAYLLNGLLGVSKENLIRDWELSSFSWSMRYRGDGYWTGFSQFIDLVDSYEGNTLSEKIENVMINTLGLTQAEVDSIKNIMLEK